MEPISADSLHKAADLEGDGWDARRLRRAAETVADLRARLDKLYDAMTWWVNQPTHSQWQGWSAMRKALDEERAHREREASHD